MGGLRLKTTRFTNHEKGKSRTGRERPHCAHCNPQSAKKPILAFFPAPRHHRDRLLPVPGCINMLAHTAHPCLLLQASASCNGFPPTQDSVQACNPHEMGAPGWGNMPAVLKRTPDTLRKSRAHALKPNGSRPYGANLVCQGMSPSKSAARDTGLAAENLCIEQENR